MAAGHGTGTLFAEAHASAATTVSTGTGAIASGDANRVLIAFLTFSGVAQSGVGVVLDPTGVNQALTFIGLKANSNNTTQVQLWALLNPSSVTSKLVVATWTGAVTASIAADTFVGADQGGVTATVAGVVSSTGTSTAPSLVIPTAAGNATVDITSDNPAVGTLSAPTPQTQMFLTNALTDNGGGYILSAGASDTHGWTISPSTQWVMLGAVIYAVGQVPSSGSLVMSPTRNFAPFYGEW